MLRCYDEPMHIIHSDLGTWDGALAPNVASLGRPANPCACEKLGRYCTYIHTCIHAYIIGTGVRPGELLGWCCALVARSVLGVGDVPFQLLRLVPSLSSVAPGQAQDTPSSSSWHWKCFET